MSLFSPVINGDLAPEKRSGHVAVYHKGLLVVYGGYGETVEKNDEEFMPLNTVWSYNVEASQWTRNTAKGVLPKKLSGACAGVMDGKMIMFGGFAENEEHVNNLYSLDLHNFVWKELTSEVKGVQPSLRDKFGCWVVGSKIIYFGGFGKPPDNINKVKGEFCYEELPDNYLLGGGWNNNLFVLKFGDHMCWKQPTCFGDIPSPRAAFSTCRIGTKCYLFGGRFKEDRRNDLYCLDAKTFTWTHLLPIGEEAPCGRSWTTMEAVSDQHLFIYGGFDNCGNALKDTWIYDTVNETWSELPNASSHLDFFAPRMWHKSCVTDIPGEVVIFGGCVNPVIGHEHTIHTNTISIFRFSPLPLQRIALDYIMQNIGRFSNSFHRLPRSIQRSIRHRSHALGLGTATGHGKLINCEIM